MPDFYFASELSGFSVPAGDPPAVITVCDSSGVEIFRNAYTSKNQFEVSLMDILNSSLRNNGLSYADFRISASRPWKNGSLSEVASLQATVIHCPVSMPAQASEWLRSNFLIESKEIIVPAEAVVDFDIPVLTDSPQNCRTTQLFTQDGKPQQASLDWPVSPGGDSIQVKADLVKRLAPAFLRLECGDRSLTARFTTDNAERLHTFTFRNRFNAVEQLSVSGILKLSPQAEKTTAKINGREHTLDIEDKGTFSLSVSGLSFSQSRRLISLLHSRQVSWLHTPIHAAPVPIDITDISGDIEDNPASLCSLSIKFKKT